MPPAPISALEPLLRRRSVPSRLLGEPGPDDSQTRAMLDAALRVPDHGRLTPWRLLRIQGEARVRLGLALAARRLELEPQAPDAVVGKDRERFIQAPLVIAVVACITPGHKIPEREQLLSAGCVCFSLLQAAQALGFGAQWLTGWAAYDEVIAARLGLEQNESIAGFIHIGSISEPAPQRPYPVADERLREWTG